MDAAELRYRANDIRRALTAAYELRLHVENLAAVRGYADADVCKLTRTCAQLAERQAHAERSLHELTLARCIEAQGHEVSESPFAAESAQQFRRVG